MSGTAGRPSWDRRDFRRLWLGETVSMVGSHVSELAVPLTALLVLGAGPAQLGLLSALQYLPIVLVTLPAGVLADRCNPRHIIVLADAGRAAVYGTAALLAATGVLSLPVLGALAFAGGVLTAVFDVAYTAYLPTLVPEAALVDANARLEASSSVAEIGGKGLAGLLVQVAGVPAALLADAASYVCSGAAVLAIRRRPAAPARAPVTLAAVVRDVRAGLALTFRSDVLRPLMVQSAWLNMLLEVAFVILPLYAVKELGLGAAALGLVLAVGSVGALAGCVSAAWLGRRRGVRSALVAGMGLACCGLALVPLAPQPPALAALALTVALAVHGFGLGVFNVHSLSLRQLATPAEVLGRTIASYRLVTWGGIPVGALIGGTAAAALGPREALAAVACGLAASALLFALTMERRFPHSAAHLAVPSLSPGDR